VVGVLLAPVGNRWRARIVTYPNVLWVIPGGGTMKFVAGTIEDAEKQAVEFITDHCRIQGWALKQGAPSAESAAIDPEQDAEVAGAAEVEASQRQLHETPILYGIDRPTTRSTTGDLSAAGLFVVSDDPLPVGTNLRLFISLDGFGLPLRGIVQWSREKPESTRPPGMGVKLVNAHPRYVAYVRKRAAASEGDDVEAGDAEPGGDD